jgi:hypothetical protein
MIVRFYAMRYWKAAGFAAVAAVIIGGLVFWAMLPKPVALAGRQTFDASPEGWFGYGRGARVRVTTDPQHVRQGAGALELEYTAAPGQADSAVVLVADGSLAGLRRLRFWIKTDQDTAAAVVLSEKKPNGGDYSAWFWSPKQQWQHIELVPGDFALNEGPADAKDADGRLDVAAVHGAGFIDIGQFFGSISADRAFPLFLQATTGKHYIHVDDFEVVKDQAAPPAASPRIGDPSRGFISWFTLGGATLSLSKPGKPFGQAGYEVNYEQTPTKYVAIVHGLSNLDLGQASALRLDIASLKPATVTVYLEERNPGNDLGPRYISTLDIAGGSTPSHRTLAISDFMPDGTGPADPDGRLSPGRLRSISLIDVTGARLIGPERNTLWISSIEPIAR